ncbi:MAG TPA: MFS transporter, partial [Polyangiaceae bacterium]
MPPHGSPAWLAKRRVALGAVLVGQVVAAFEGTVVTSAMPTIVRELGGLAAYGWVFSSFLVASTVAVLVCGKLADTLGRLPVFLGGMGLFLLGSCLCGSATSFEGLVAFRVVQGLGAGALTPIAMTISADLYTLRERVKVQTLFTAAWGAANALGPLIGGWIVTYSSWRLAFLVNVPIGALTVVLLVVSYRDPPRARRGPVGAGGALLAGVTAALALLALEPAGQRGVGPGARLLAMAAAIAAMVGLYRNQRRSEAPILPGSLLPDPVVRAGVAGGVCAGGLLYSTTAYVPLWLAHQQHESALTSGAALMPLLVGWAVGSSFGVHVLVRWGMRTSVGGGFAIASVGAAALCFAALRGLGPSWVFAALALLGLGLGPAASTSLVAPQSHVAWQYRGMITSTVYASRMLGGSLAVAALGSGGGTTPVWRFFGILGIAVGALVLTVLVAPGRVRDAAPAEP